MLPGQPVHQERPSGSRSGKGTDESREGNGRRTAGILAE